MKAVIYKNVNEYYVDNVAEPQINTVLNVKIKVLYCGICGSDIHKLLYEKPNLDYVKTDILGHEIAGIETEIGDNVKQIKKGDLVVIEPLLYCNNCAMCQKGYIQFCENLKSLGKDFQGGFAEYIIANEKQLYKISNKENVKISTLSDPYSIAIHIRNITKNFQKSNIAIIGDGIIGMSCAEVLKDKLNEITVFGKHENRREMLKNVNAKYVDIKTINEYNNHFDYVIEAVGGRQSSTLYNSINICKPKGSIIVSGVYDNNFNFDLSLRNAFYKELNIIRCNSFEKENNISEFKIALDFLNSKSKLADKLISKIFPITQFSEAVDYIKNRKENNCVKIMIKM